VADKDYTVYFDKDDLQIAFLISGDDMAIVDKYFEVKVY